MYLHRTVDSSEEPMDRTYDDEFEVSEEYRESLPDMNDAAGAVLGANVPIQQVGVSNFRLPLRFSGPGGEELVLETSVTGSVSLDANVKGINMSRIIRSFYEHGDRTFSLGTLEEILHGYREKVGALNARVRLDFSYPMVQQSLRSEHWGYQYYKAAFEGVLERDGALRTFLHMDFVYSSACPCSSELAEHARDVRGVYAIPHSQRSKARVSVEMHDGEEVTIPELQAHCLRALRTETQVVVRREDEQAFAEMNGSYTKFVEDAARLVYEQLDADPRIRDFQVACAHLESLHSHDAVSVICRGVPGGFTADFTDFQSLVC